MDRNVEVLKRDVSSDEADKKHVGAAKKGKRIYSTERQAESPLAAVIPGKIVLHVSSFKQKVAAEKETQRLGEYGYNTFIGTKEVSGKKSFLVYIGTFQNKRAALKMGSKLRGKGIISYFTPKEMEQNIRLEEQ